VSGFLSRPPRDQSTVNPNIDASDFSPSPRAKRQKPFGVPRSRSDTKRLNHGGTGDQSTVNLDVDVSGVSSRPQAKRQMPSGPRRLSDTKRPPWR
jgi:hypothetical protein